MTKKMLIWLISISAFLILVVVLSIIFKQFIKQIISGSGVFAVTTLAFLQGITNKIENLRKEQEELENDLNAVNEDLENEENTDNMSIDDKLEQYADEFRKGKQK